MKDKNGGEIEICEMNFANPEVATPEIENWILENEKLEKEKDEIKITPDKNGKKSTLELTNLKYINDGLKIGCEIGWGAETASSAFIPLRLYSKDIFFVSNVANTFI